MGKVGKFDEVRVDPSPNGFFCPYSPTRSPCEKSCARHVIKRRLVGGRVVFDGCIDKWESVKGDFELF